MAKQGLSYYQAETDRFQDIRIKRLKKHFGCEGYAVYTYVVNEIFRVEGSYIIFDENQAFDTAEYWSLDEDQVMKIIEYCAEISLFDTKLWHTRKILTSPQIQQRYSEICRRAKKRIAIPDEITLISDRSAIQTPEFAEVAQPVENQAPQNSAEIRRTPQESDGNFDKEKKRKINPPSYSPQGGEPRKDEFNNLLQNLAANVSQPTAPKPETKRNTAGIMYYLEKYHIPQKEADEILTLCRYGEIGNPVWSLFQEIDRSRGKITMPGRFVLSRLRPS